MFPCEEDCLYLFCDSQGLCKNRELFLMYVMHECIWSVAGLSFFTKPCVLAEYNVYKSGHTYFSL